jgi:hypothetical protein
MKRREFLRSFSALGLSPLAASNRDDTLPAFSVKALTSGPKHHFFGYYGITPWNLLGKHLVCLESSFQDHLASPEEAAAVGLADSATGQFRKVAETRAWNLQQGAMLHWSPLAPETSILFNDRRGGDIISVALDVKSGKKRDLPRAISAVSHNGRYALSLTYGRLARMRPVVGYVEARDPNPDSPAPKNDGVFLMDLATGKSRLVVSIAEVYERLVRKHPRIKSRHMWFNHVVFNKNDSRFFFLARVWSQNKAKPELESAMFTVGVDGSALREAFPFGKVSHFDWQTNDKILVTGSLHGGEMKYYMFTDGKSDYQSIGEDFFDGGHPSFAPGGNWIVTDSGDGRKLEKRLMVYSLKMGKGLVLGSFPMKEKRYYTGDLRCDLHPRWNRTGDAICFDALETRNWTRQLHVAKLDFA